MAEPRTNPFSAPATPQDRWVFFIALRLLPTGDALRVVDPFDRAHGRPPADTAARSEAWEEAREIARWMEKDLRWIAPVSDGALSRLRRKERGVMQPVALTENGRSTSLRVASEVLGEWPGLFSPQPTSEIDLDFLSVLALRLLTPPHAEPISAQQMAERIYVQLLLSGHPMDEVVRAKRVRDVERILEALAEDAKAGRDSPVRLAENKGWRSPISRYVANEGFAGNLQAVISAVQTANSGRPTYISIPSKDTADQIPATEEEINAQLRVKVKTLQDNLTGLGQERELLERDRQTLKESLEEANKAIGNLESDIATAQADKSALENRNTRLLDGFAQERKELEEAARKNLEGKQAQWKRAAEKARDTAIREAVQSEIENARVAQRQALQDAHKTWQNESRTIQNSLRSDLKAAESERDEAKNEVAETKELAEQATSKLSDMITQGTELAAAAEEAGTLRKRVEDLAQQLTGAQQEAADARDLAEQATSQWEEALAQGTDLATAAEEAGRLREQMADVEVLTNKLAASEQQLERAKETNQKLQSSTDTERQELKGKAEGLRSDLKAAEDERDEAKQEVAGVRKLAEQATSRWEEALTQGTELAATAQEAGTLRKRVEDLTQQLAGAQQEAANARDLAEQATSKLEEALARGNELTAAVQEAGGLQARSGAQ